MSISYIDGIIRRKRNDLDDLERFARTPAYGRLLQAARQRGVADRERWLADWLLQPMSGLGSRPLDLAGLPDGIERLLKQIHFMVGRD
jgi:hypothetical protein